MYWESAGGGGEKKEKQTQICAGNRKRRGARETIITCKCGRGIASDREIERGRASSGSKTCREVVSAVAVAIGNVQYHGKSAMLLLLRWWQIAHTHTHTHANSSIE